MINRIQQYMKLMFIDLSSRRFFVIKWILEKVICVYKFLVKIGNCLFLFFLDKIVEGFQKFYGIERSICLYVIGFRLQVSVWVMGFFFLVYFVLNKIVWNLFFKGLFMVYRECLCGVGYLFIFFLGQCLKLQGYFFFWYFLKYN